MTPLSEVVESALGGHRAPGAVVAVQAQGSQLDLAAVNAERSELFEIGSVAKTMTALLILQHVQRGDIQLDDSIKSYLPDLQPGDQDQTAQVTIRHLLTHTSGIDCGDDFTDTGDDDDCLGTFVSEALTGVGFLFPPGQRWSYNNGGYSILGRLIEVLDDRTWDDALIDRVFVPLGMSATTTARLNPELLISLGHRYDPKVGAVVAEPRRMPRSAGPAGNVVATVDDLISFATCIFGEPSRLLNDGLIAEMLRPQVPLREGNQGLGWVIPRSGLAVHGGATLGSTAFLASMRGLGTMCVLANGPGAGFIATKVQAHLFGAPISRVPQPGPLSDVAPARCVGRYARRHAQIELTWDEDQLLATSTFSGPASLLFTTPEPVRLESIGGGRFVSQRIYEDGNTIWDFEDLDDDGVPSALFTTRISRRIA